MAFALAFKATRAVLPSTPLQDAIYIESLHLLFPTYTLTPVVSDDLVLGGWLTGGLRISTTSLRRLAQVVNWMPPADLAEVVLASGVIEGEQSAQSPESSRGSSFVTDIDVGEVSVESDDNSTAPLGPRFELPGRRALESFFNEHVLDIIVHRERYAALGIGFPSAIILHGPPGCGKTYAVDQLAEFLGWPTIRLDASNLASPYIHETSRKIGDAFKQAIDTAPSIIIIDEMDSFLADRTSSGGSHQHHVEEVAEFLRKIPEATKNDVLVIGMTNRLEMVDEAIMRRGRFDHVLRVEMPGEQEVLALLSRLLRDIPMDDGVDLPQIARRLSGRPLSDVAFVIREGARLSVRAGLGCIGQRFLLDAVTMTPDRLDTDSNRRIGFS